MLRNGAPHPNDPYTLLGFMIGVSVSVLTPNAGSSETQVRSDGVKCGAAQARARAEHAAIVGNTQSIPTSLQYATR